MLWHESDLAAPEVDQDTVMAHSDDNDDAYDSSPSRFHKTCNASADEWFGRDDTCMQIESAAAAADDWNWSSCLALEADAPPSTPAGAAATVRESAGEKKTGADSAPTKDVTTRELMQVQRATVFLYDVAPEPVARLEWRVSNDDVRIVDVMQHTTTKRLYAVAADVMRVLMPATEHKKTDVRLYRYSGHLWSPREKAQTTLRRRDHKGVLRSQARANIWSYDGIVTLINGPFRGHFALAGLQFVTKTVLPALRG